MQKRLREGGRIAIVAPSGTIDEGYLQKGVEALVKAGYDVRLMPHVCDSPVSVFSSGDKERASDLTEALQSSDTDIVWCTRGGYGAVRTLQNIDLDLLRKTDKVLVGFSDITALHSVAVNAGKKSLLGPMLKHIATHGLESQDVKNTLALLQGKTVSIECQAGKGSREGSTRAKVVGGNLSIIYSLRGTPADIRTKGRILFIEDLMEYRYHIDRMIQNLKFSGVLQGLAGLVVGQMTGMHDGATAFGRDAYEIVADAVAEYDYPVLMGFPSGHDDSQNQPLLLGGEAILEVKDGRGSLTMGMRLQK